MYKSRATHAALAKWIWCLNFEAIMQFSYLRPINVNDNTGMWFIIFEFIARTYKNEG